MIYGERAGTRTQDPLIKGRVVRLLLLIQDLAP